VRTKTRTSSPVGLGDTGVIGRATKLSQWHLASPSLPTCSRRVRPGRVLSDTPLVPEDRVRKGGRGGEGETFADAPGARVLPVTSSKPVDPLLMSAPLAHVSRAPATPAEPEHGDHISSLDPRPSKRASCLSLSAFAQGRRSCTGDHC